VHPYDRISFSGQIAWQLLWIGDIRKNLPNRTTKSVTLRSKCLCLNRDAFLETQKTQKPTVVFWINASGQEI
jgi:hypothetical protein